MSDNGNVDYRMLYDRFDHRALRKGRAIFSAILLLFGIAVFVGHFFVDDDRLGTGLLVVAVVFGVVGLVFAALAASKVGPIDIDS